MPKWKKEEEETRRKQHIGKCVSAIMNHKNALIAELQSKKPVMSMISEKLGLKSDFHGSCQCRCEDSAQKRLFWHISTVQRCNNCIETSQRQTPSAQLPQWFRRVREDCRSGTHADVDKTCRSSVSVEVFKVACSVVSDQVLN